MDNNTEEFLKRLKEGKVPVSELFPKRKAVEKEYEGKFGLIGFDAEAKTIRLDSNHVIRLIPQKEVDAFYDRVGKWKTHEDEFYARNRYFLFYSYVSKGVIDHFSEELATTYKLFETFFRVFFDRAISLPFCNRSVRHLDELQSIGFLRFEARPYFYPNIAPFSRADIHKLKKYWRVFYTEPVLNNKALMVAIRRLHSSYQRYNQEDILIDLMIAFEALFLPEKSELNFRIALRVSKLLDLEHDSQYTFNLMKTSYNLRSKVVHGDPLKDKDLKFSGRLATLDTFNLLLKETLQSALRIYLLRSKALPLEEFTKRIDHGIVSSKSISHYFEK